MMKGPSQARRNRGGKARGAVAPNIFMSDAKKMVRTCKERTAKCEIKSNHLEKLKLVALKHNKC